MNIVDSIIRKKVHCYFISPHLDDAILSCGQLLLQLQGKVPITIVTVFTDSSEKPYTLSAKKFLQQCGYTNAKDLYKQRKKEDTQTINTLRQVKRYHLGFIDALWRKKATIPPFVKPFAQWIPEIQHIYPTYKFHIIRGNISSHDSLLERDIRTTLKKIVSTKNSVVFAPIGLGNHVDHVLVTKLCTELFPQHIAWSDFPYNLLSASSMDGTQSQFSLTVSKEKKDLMRRYTSQITAMFPTGIPTTREIYTYKGKLHFT